jgi:hypothetical protein
MGQISGAMNKGLNTSIQMKCLGDINKLGLDTKRFSGQETKHSAI